MLKYDDRGRFYNLNETFLIFPVLHCFWRSQQLGRISKSFYHLGCEREILLLSQSLVSFLAELQFVDFE